MTEKEGYPKSFQDVPEHQAGMTSSIGGLWPPEPASFNRIKGFYTEGVVSSRSTLEVIESEFYKCCEKMFESEVSRVQFRAVVDGRFLRHESSTSEFLGIHVEAVVPLDQGEFGEDPVLLYFGKNREDRLPSKEDLERIQQNLEASSGRERKSPEAIFERAVGAGYTINLLPPNPSEDTAVFNQMARLYERFGWSRGDVKDLLENPDNLIAVAEKDGRIVSAGIAESVAIPVGNLVLRMVEITEAATLDTHNGNGVYTAVSTRLLLELAEMSRQRELKGGEVDIVFGECNGLSGGVLRVAKTQGRIFATEVGEHYGFNGRGVLPQQVPISGAEKNTEHNDLLPAFLTRSMLYNFYGSKHE